ncbi:MAG: transporter [Verrucomicrobiales bacterium]|nr:transporter [Verrucomicrobiales bacterium]
MIRPSSIHALSPEAVAARNIQAFLWFRVLFNSRFYYPIFTILFLDFGLTIEQFAGLNALWAASIAIFEVPSGALADRLGRRRLVVLASWLMVIEMALLCLMPIGGSWVWPLMALNRVISGLAEACCSGADEALVYDALPEAGKQEAWTRVLARLMRWQSLTFMGVALMGAAVYSPDFMNRALRTVGSEIHLSKEFCMRIPLVLNLLMALTCVVSSLRFTDTREHAPNTSGLHALIRASYHQMLDAARGILRSPAAIVIILTGLLYDSFIRLYYSIGSNYYRLLGIDEQWNGLILTVSSLIGLGTAFVVEKLLGTASPSRNMGTVAILIFLGLTGISLIIPGWAGVIFVVPLWLAMRSLHYFISQYLNRVSSPSTRATVLSFKGLTMNLAYGAVMLMYQLQTWMLRGTHRGELSGLPKESVDTRLLAMAMPWWPAVFGVLALGLVIWVRVRFRSNLTGLLMDKTSRSGIHLEPGELSAR